MSDKHSFVYVTYIQASPEKVFAALTDGELSKDYWGRSRIQSTDWRAGSSWQSVNYDDASDIDVEGTVVEHDPPRRLVLLWKGKNGTSRVTFAVEAFLDPRMGTTKLTVLHDDLPDDKALADVSSGWPAILSSLKTLLETGTAMPGTQRRWAPAKK
ncbi:MAG TPA: SRPBCC family protein [Myxococcota bacterium]|jgi:uncharacterized protein YndB with AHSA1/START domain